MIRHCKFRYVSILVLAIIGSFISPGMVLAQEQPVALDISARERLFHQLALDAEEFDKRNVLKRVVRLAKPSVVHLTAQKNIDDLTNRKVEEAGSGVLLEVNNKIYVLTNRHVIHPCKLDDIKIQLDNGRRVTAQSVLSDPATDLAVIEIEQADDLVAARTGDSTNLEIGDFVVAIGSPFGLSHSVTYGIISAKGRRDLKLGKQGVVIQNFIQTDAAINPGNSGGPLLSLRGEVVGINTAIASNSGGNEGIGFTIPINMAITTAKKLVGGDGIERAYLGVRMDHNFVDATALKLGLSHARGVRVTGIIANSPADKSHLQVNDVILAFNGEAIENDDHLSSMVGLTEVDSVIELLLIRKRKPLTVKVTLKHREDFEKGS